MLVHDHRNFGASDSAVRHDIEPWLQIADWRRAISFLESLPEVDAARIGIWGTSYAGGHVMVIAFYLQPQQPGAWKNEVAVISGRLAKMYEPGHWIARVSPTPLLMNLTG